MTTRQNLHSDLAIAPGEYLVEVLEDLEMSQAELARRMGRPTQVINEIVKGTKAITPDTALQLEKVIPDVPAYLWTGLEEEYRLTLARQEDERQLEQEAELLNPDAFDPKLYDAMAKQGWIKKSPEKIGKVKELLKYFGVSSLYNLAEVRSYSPAFRLSKSQEHSACDYALAAWLRKGELEARGLEKVTDVRPFNADKLKALLPQLRALTLKDPEVFLPEAQRLLAGCGVLHVVLRHLPKTYAHGATFWLTPTKVVVQVSDRMKWADIFWFSLFHELGHVLLHGKRNTIVTFDKKDVYRDENSLKLEGEADNFASNALIPYDEYLDFISRGNFSALRVKAFAKRIGIAPGIIVGRLQHERHILSNQLRELREQYEIDT